MTTFDLIQVQGERDAAAALFAGTSRRSANVYNADRIIKLRLSLSRFSFSPSVALSRGYRPSKCKLAIARANRGNPRLVPLSPFALLSISSMSNNGRIIH